MNELTTAAPLAVVETSSTVLAAQAKALVEARYTVAINRPRDWDTVRERLLKDCRRPGFADSAIYHKPIGKGIEGPSIRFAEAAIRNMNNVTVETATIFDDSERRIMRVTVTDLEANVPYSQDVTVAKTVERNSVKPGEVAIRTRTSGSTSAESAADTLSADVFNRLMADPTLGGLAQDIQPGAMVWEDEEGDTPIAVCTLRATVLHRTTDLSIAA